MPDETSSPPILSTSRPASSRSVFHEDDYTHPCHPLYVHPCDVHGTSLVTVPFDGTGYESWRRTIMFSVKPPNTSPLARQWQKCNALVISWLTNSLSKEIACSVEYSELAKDIWGELEERYGQEDAAIIFELKKGVSSYLTRDLHTVYSILLSDEKQRQVSNSSQFLPSSTSFNAGVSKQVYFSRVYFDSLKSSICKYCKKLGHTIDKCYKLHGYPPNFKFIKGSGPRKTVAHVQLEMVDIWL
ncbi:PREDICTED: uncharacterized protein LOC109213764 [Nicotiana attenuata]|uniref:uncharacterized protein LOC109213764 n=1 Tax=Nicotiana attenuata TaxID=49451 RepID=UPI000905B321|nr:PREDICTED: uncharacterized protein LOC109213764 [Nicotiana attenuata]